ncbi:hypothetical protein N9273_00080 [bacterium]|nr:hypothetical protein [bacterium]
MKTLDIFNKYNKIFKENVDLNSPDATDIEELPVNDLDSGVEELTSEGEKYLVELLVKAFMHEPDESGAAVAKELQGQIDEDPKGVTAAISNMVELGEGDMKETLALA